MFWKECIAWLSTSYKYGEHLHSIVLYTSEFIRFIYQSVFLFMINWCGMFKIKRKLSKSIIYKNWFLTFLVEIITLCEIVWMNAFVVLNIFGIQCMPISTVTVPNILYSLFCLKAVLIYQTLNSIFDVLIC